MDGRGSGSRLTGMLVLLLGGAVAGCDGSSVRTLTREDVTVPPAGTATGTTFSGQYLVTKNQITGCRCRVGSCLALHANVGASFPVMQTDGSIEFDTGATPATGSIDADGTFHLGFVLEEPNNVQYAVLNGHIATAGGTPTGLTLSQEATGNTGTLDCDITTHGEARYQGPLTAALGAETPPPSAFDPSVLGWR